MRGLEGRCCACLILALGALLAASAIRLSRADEGEVELPLPRLAQQGDDKAPAKAKDEKAKDEKAKEEKSKESKGKAAGGQKKKFDPAVVSSGKTAFERDCTTCHDAARSLERTKDLAGWRATVKRMAARRGADIPSEDIEPIAVYLTSRSEPAEEAAAGKEGETGGGAGAAAAAAPAPEASSSVSVFATLSPQWRGDENHLQNPGFGPLAFVGGSWSGKMVSARVTVCITCHGVQEPGLISRVDVLEAAVRVDLSQFLEPCCHGLKGGIDAGRFVVPFGAFSAQVNPGIYRTVSTPLIFNMGERIFNADIGFPVLPMPYSDEGVDLNLDIPLCKCPCNCNTISMSVDAYLVNGLEGSPSGVDFLETRDLFDNNDRACGGLRLTVGGPNVRAGASYTTGRFDDPNTSGVPRGLYYRIYGFDLQARYKKLLRFQAEYARRDSDRSGTLAVGPAVFSEGVFGYYVEGEARPWEECKVSFLVRYDSQAYSSQLPPAGSTLITGHFSVERLTLGVNVELWQQSLLMVNYERWILPELDHRNADVFGVRYTISF
jgi:hypothetical protein